MWWTIASIAVAQEPGQLRVVVVDDPDEIPIPGVTVRLSGETLIGGAQERVTDANGELLFPELPPGLYKVIASKAEFGGITVENIQVNIGRTTLQPIRMKLGSGIDFYG